MFGLMKCHPSLQTTTHKHQRRLCYCGTCKVLGGLFGQKSRVLLNSDAVFLGEILSAISDSKGILDRSDWEGRSVNCFSPPKNPEDKPLALQFAAVAALTIAEFKLADRMADSNRILWKLPALFFSGNFRAASIFLEQWGVSREDLWRFFRMQLEREKELTESGNSRLPQESLKYLAEPTAAATGLLFQHGARVVGNETAQLAMYELGHAFGALVYLLDALEDYEKDFRTKAFNALRAAYNLSGGELSAQPRAWTVQYIRRLAAETEAALDRLPIAKETANNFSGRLKANLTRRLGRKPITGDRMREGASISERLQAAFEFLSASVGAFVSRRRGRFATRRPERAGFSFNPGFLRSFLAPAVVGPLNFAWPPPVSHPSNGNTDARDETPPKKKKPGCCCRGDDPDCFVGCCCDCCCNSCCESCCSDCE
jgi:hypothetical protein